MGKMRRRSEFYAHSDGAGDDDDNEKKLRKIVNYAMCALLDQAQGHTAKQYHSHLPFRFESFFRVIVIWLHWLLVRMNCWMEDTGDAYIVRGPWVTNPLSSSASLLHSIRFVMRVCVCASIEYADYHHRSTLTISANSYQSIYLEEPDTDWQEIIAGRSSDSLAESIIIYWTNNAVLVHFYSYPHQNEKKVISVRSRSWVLCPVNAARIQKRIILAKWFLFFVHVLASLGLD